jgi:hypothetical protein
MWFTLSGYDANPDYVRGLGEAGIRVFFVCHQLPWYDPSGNEKLEREVQTILDRVPDAWIILRTGLYPPDTWFEANPSELIQFEDGTPVDTWFGKGTRIQCLCSRKWRADQVRELGTFIDWLETRPFARRTIGFFLNAGGTGEWYIPTQLVHGDRTLDHSPAFREQWSGALREWYGSEAALRAAWRRPDATFESPPIPGADDFAFLEVERALFAGYHGTDELPPAPARGAAIGSFCNPDSHRHVADYLRAVNEGTADSIVTFARAVKERTGGAQVVGAFGGGLGYVMGGISTGTARILDSGVVDFLGSPPDYTNRQPGGDAALHNIQDSYRLRNTIYIVEEDTRTVATAPCHDWGVNTLGESIEVMKRDFGRNLAEDLYAWWFDMGGAGRRWYNFPKILDLMKRQQEVMQACYTGARYQTPEIAFIYDMESSHYLGNWSMTDLCARLRGWELHRIGAPVACHYLDDLLREDMPDYKLCVFVNAFALDDRRRQGAARYLARSPRTALWLYAPGVINPAREPRLSADHIEDLTGLRACLSDAPALPYCRLTPEGARRLPDVRPDRDYGWFVDRQSFGTCEAWTHPQGLAQFTLLCPYVTGDDPSAEVLMRFNADGRPALVMRERPEGRTLAAYFKAVHAGIIRSAARLAGCHIYGDSDDVLYVGNRFVTLHAGASGAKLIQLPAPSDPFEIYERRGYGQGVRELRFELRKGETRTFHLGGPV